MWLDRAELVRIQQTKDKKALRPSVVSSLKCRLIAPPSSPLARRHWSHSLGYDDEKQRRHRV
jgi:hypothetical protein